MKSRQLHLIRPLIYLHSPSLSSFFRRSSLRRRALRSSPVAPSAPPPFLHILVFLVRLLVRLFVRENPRRKPTYLPTCEERREFGYAMVLSKCPPARPQSPSRVPLYLPVPAPIDIANTRVIPKPPRADFRVGTEGIGAAARDAHRRSQMPVFDGTRANHSSQW